MEMGFFNVGVYYPHTAVLPYLLFSFLQFQLPAVNNISKTLTRKFQK